MAKNGGLLRTFFEVAFEHVGDDSLLATRQVGQLVKEKLQPGRRSAFSLARF